MTLKDLINDNLTDKQSLHSYLPVYEHFFKNRKENVKNVLEIGVKKGGSIKLWYDYFSNATIYGIDNNYDEFIVQDIKDELIENERVKLLICKDAYNVDIAASLYGTKFDFMLDDGPHTLESMISFIKLYIHLLSDDGVLMIEDVQSIEWIHTLIESVPNELKQYIQFFDLRGIKGKYDDIVFVIDKSRKLF